MTETSAAVHPRSARDLDAATPADRDRWVDALRVGSLFVVVLGHWFMVALTPSGQISNTLAILPSLQPVTWLLQVMPLFFLVGGIAHAHSLESLAARHPDRTGRYAAFVRSRAERLLRPTFAFLAVWVGLGVVAHVTGLTGRSGGDSDGALVRSALVMVPQLLWFVGIYLGVCACAPGMRRLHARWGPAVPVALVALAVIVDVVRFGGGPELVGNINFALVWLALHQLGFAWRDGVLTSRAGWAMVVVGFGGMLAAVIAGPYPVSMVGLPGETVSNMAPPTAALLAQGIGICGLAVVVRSPMGRLLTRPRAWKTVLAGAPFAMTAFLWHLTALLFALMVLRGLNIEQPEVGSIGWWLSRPLLVAMLAVVTAGLVGVFVRFDRAGTTRPERGVVATRRRHGEGRRGWVDLLAGVAALVIFFGVLIVSVAGVDVLGNRPVFFLLGEVTPAIGLVVLGAGVGLLAVTGRVDQAADQSAPAAVRTAAIAD
ncbi:MAG: acyltransferase [Humibacillus sp.]|nr:acyltransferase [Humibacillus sp.]MDN5777609.1 acyltransferase [Humibacillus sp.]